MKALRFAVPCEERYRANAPLQWSQHSASQDVLRFMQIKGPAPIPRLPIHAKHKRDVRFDGFEIIENVDDLLKVEACDELEFHAIIGRRSEPVA